MHQFHINAVAFKEGDAWVIQGIEYDIVAHTREVTTLPHAFMRAVSENIIITQSLGRQPLEGIKAAPERFRALYESASVEMRLTRKNDQEPDVAVRLAA